MPHINCQCCDGTAWKTKWEGLIICQQCGVMTVNATYTAADLRALYQDSYFCGDEYADYVNDKPVIQRTLNGHHSLLLRHVAAGSSILEVGCAFGYFLEMLQRSFPESEGIDVCESAVTAARAAGLTARSGDLANTAYTRRFDAACLWDTIEHVPNPRQVFERLYDVIRPHGHLLLTTGDFGALVPRLQGRRWRQIHPPTHLFYFTRRSLSLLCHNTGFRVVRFGTVPVYRRLGSSLRTLHRLRPNAVTGRLAGGLVKMIPAPVLDWDFPLNLGDTLYMVAQRT